MLTGAVITPVTAACGRLSMPREVCHRFCASVFLLNPFPSPPLTATAPELEIELHADLREAASRIDVGCCQVAYALFSVSTVSTFSAL